VDIIVPHLKPWEWYGIIKRVGSLLLFNPLRAQGSWSLNLDKRDDRMVADMIIQLKIKEKGHMISYESHISCINIISNLHIFKPALHPGKRAVLNRFATKWTICPSIFDQSHPVTCCPSQGSWSFTCRASKWQSLIWNCATSLPKSVQSKNG
jgi:hypothetical protein